ncbi:MAG: glycosyltransferase family A protein [Xenococcaceae cyanobacterium MO_167.B27]|nr:glycosyltransferase family A protein [Xenococcaceae cyanobacterium MO_167.B27]
MKVSVIIITHNRPLEFQAALKSVLQQTRKPDEIIVIDDGSNPDLKPNMANLSSDFVPIKLKRFEVPQKPCRARNKGAEIASGDILMFLDDDDTWETTKIREQLSVFEQNPDVGLVYSGRLIVSSKNREKILYRIKPKFAGNLYPEILSQNVIGPPSSVAIKKLLFTEVGGFDPNMKAYEDYDLWIRCCQKTIIGHDNSCNVRYTLTEKPNAQRSGQIKVQVQGKLSYRHLEGVHQLLDKYQEEIELQGTIKARIIRATRFFAVAKSLRRHGLRQSLPFIWASFCQYPSLKVLALIMPPRIIQLVRGFI